ncbi:uncharacterized protein KY384_001969 [Bacidia gigantensis]|uniref:uncharacterized protein n=1 Tax=Bacidia gigantensis TaxID=2732470 RepID=UPI001D055F97|nr:uncharacterized protein KY384_001969 [Bacidia gigantensis]KAG8533186.1 hypothetical protein KY384_001969 [Bacidia gigantensis]
MSPSPSGVASLRARFEQNQQDKDNSPPSRGRSPAASVNSEHNRPLSKIRTSFVAVEPSGHMASTLDVPKLGPSTLDGAHETIGPDVRNSLGHQPIHREKTADLTSHVNGETANPGKPVSTAEDHVPKMLSSDPKDEATVSGGKALPGDNESLGSILKGSPFEGETALHKPPSIPAPTKPQSAKQASASQKSSTAKQSSDTRLPNQLPHAAASKHSVTLAPTQALKEPVKEPPKHNPLVNGKPKEATNTKTTRNGIKSAPDATDHSEAATKEPEKPLPHRKRAEASLNGPHAVSLSPTGAKASTAKPHPGIASSKTHSVSKPEQNKPARHPTQTLHKAADTAKQAVKNPTTAIKSAASKPTILNTGGPKPAKKSSPASPSFNKPRPKSPTKPAKLPTAATAPTASSAAKHGPEASVPAPRVSSRQSSASYVPNGRIASLTKTSKPARASLPPNSKPYEKPKPKARASMASTAVPSGNFLERMMRPTQSSAQKTHEKVEPKSPPRKNASHATRPKRKSSESTDTKSDGKASKDEIMEIGEEPLAEVPEEGSNVEPTQAPPAIATATGAAQEVTRGIENTEPASQALEAY